MHTLSDNNPQQLGASFMACIFNKYGSLVHFLGMLKEKELDHKLLILAKPEGNFRIDTIHYAKMVIVTEESDRIMFQSVGNNKSEASFAYEVLRLLKSIHPKHLEYELLVYDEQKGHVHNAWVDVHDTSNEACFLFCY